MDEMNFEENRPRYRLVRNNSTHEFSNLNNDSHHRHQRHPSYVRNKCTTPDAYNNRSFFRLYEQDPHSVHWNFTNCNKDQANCKCSASTPKIHQMPIEYDPRNEEFLYVPRSHSPSLSIPTYYSLKVNPSKKNDLQHFSDSKTLGRHKEKNRSSFVVNSRWSPNENVKNCHSERCLNWLQNSGEYESMEEQMKELDMNIELLQWKKKHLEGVRQQKMQSLRRRGEIITGHQLDSPPPLSDIAKPDISVDDGFESVADTCNNPLTHKFSDLETELRKQQQRAKYFEENFKKQEICHQSDIEKLRNFYEKRASKERPPGRDFSPATTPGQEKLHAVRPKSFKRELFPDCQSGGRGQDSSEILNLKAELYIKDQHLKKLRAALKELSSRHSELLDLYMMSSKSKPGDSKDSTQLIEDLGRVVGDFQKVFTSTGRTGRNSGMGVPNLVTTPSGEQLTKLQQSVERLKLEVKRRCPVKQQSPLNNNRQ